MNSELFSEISFEKFIFKIQKNLLYSSNHLWFDFNNSKITIGLSDYLQQTIGDIAFLSFPKIGTLIKPTLPLIEIETMKVNHEVIVPFQGIIIDTNNELIDFPELINNDPYGKGWLLNIKVENIEMIKNTQMNAEEYRKYLLNEIESR